MNSFDDSEKQKIPFTVTPPLFRIEPESVNAIRIVLTDPKLPSDKESIYWLNVKSIPPSDPNATNNLTISINNKIKVNLSPSGFTNSRCIYCL